MTTNKAERDWGANLSRLSMTWVYGPDGLEFHWTLQPPPANVVELKTDNDEPPLAA